MKTSETIEQHLRSLLAEISGQQGFSLDTPLFRGGLELDSLSVATLIAAVERDFGIAVAEEDLSLTSLFSLRTLCQFVAARKCCRGR
jgi:acyl carrier protein